MAGQQPVQVDVAHLGDAQQVVLRRGICAARRWRPSSRARRAPPRTPSGVSAPRTRRRRSPSVMGVARMRRAVTSNRVCCIFVTAVARNAKILLASATRPNTIIAAIRSHVDYQRRTDTDVEPDPPFRTPRPRALRAGRAHGNAQRRHASCVQLITLAGQFRRAVDGCSVPRPEDIPPGLKAEQSEGRTQYPLPNVPPAVEAWLFRVRAPRRARAQSTREGKERGHHACNADDDESDHRRATAHGAVLAIGRVGAGRAGIGRIAFQAIGARVRLAWASNATAVGFPPRERPCRRIPPAAGSPDAKAAPGFFVARSHNN